MCKVFSTTVQYRNNQRASKSLAARTYNYPADAKHILLCQRTIHYYEKLDNLYCVICFA